MPFLPLHQHEARHVRISDMRTDAPGCIVYLVSAKSDNAGLARLALAGLRAHERHAELSLQPIYGAKALPPEAEEEAVRLFLTIAFEQLGLRNVYTIVAEAGDTDRRARLERLGFLHGTKTKAGLLMDCINPTILRSCAS